MSPTDIIALLEQVPYGGKVIAWLPVLITIGATLATVSPAPTTDPTMWLGIIDRSWAAYRLAYRALQWCALNVGRARNSSDPVAQAAVLTEQMAQATLTTGPAFPGARSVEAVTPEERAAVVDDIVDKTAAITDVKVRP